jgi:hypothetical protein
MLRRCLAASTLAVHYAVGSVYVLSQLAMYERNVRALHEA